MACEQRGVALLILSAKVNGEGAGPQQPVMNVLSHAAVDGIILHALSGCDDVVTIARQRQVPLVIIDQPQPRDVALVCIDDRRAAYEIAREIVQRGHRRVAVIALRGDRSGRCGFMTQERIAGMQSSTSRLRPAGFMAAFAEVGIAPEAVPVWEASESSEAAGRAAAEAILARSGERPTAIAAMSDRLAIGALSLLKERAIRLGTDIVMTGFDDIPEAAIHGLATVRQPFMQKGEAAVKAILDGLDPCVVPLDFTIVRRSSLGEPGGSSVHGPTVWCDQRDCELVYARRLSLSCGSSCWFACGG
ncbi:substrate-binding domain-containing protein, partial [Gluconacetobacter sacchari]|nr:substrate-binding domain-containing protein [Gluconacetobacter sacchari]